MSSDRILSVRCPSSTATTLTPSIFIRKTLNFLHPQCTAPMYTVQSRSSLAQIVSNRNDSSILGNEISMFGTFILDSSILPSIWCSHSPPFEGHEVFRRRRSIVLYERSSIRCLRRIRAVDCMIQVGKGTLIPTKRLKQLQSGLAHYMVLPCGNTDFNLKRLTFTIETPLIPPIHCHYEFHRKSVKIIQEDSSS